MVEGESILILTMMGMAVLNVFGVYYLWREQIGPRFWNMKGKIMIKQLMPNGRFKTIWVKPEIETSKKSNPSEKSNGEETGEYGYFFKIGNRRLPLVDTPGALYQEGPKKMAIYDSEGNQVIVTGLKKLMSPVSAEMLDSLATRTWNAARAFGFLDKRFMQIIGMIAIVTIVALLIEFVIFGQIGQLTDKVGALSQQITDTASKGVTQSGGLTPA